MTEIKESPVSVWWKRELKGWEEGDPTSVQQHPVVQLIAALVAVYSTDAHFVPYHIEGNTEYCPRINKLAIKDPDTGELIDGRKVVYTAIVIDVDMPKEDDDHGRPAVDKNDPAAVEAWFDQQSDLIESMKEKWFDCHGFYATRGGYRLIWRLPESLPPSKWAGYRAGVVVELWTKYGIAADPNTSDLGRCYRLPRVLRDGVQQDHDMDLAGLDNTIDLDTITWTDPDDVMDLLGLDKSSDHGVIDSIFAGIQNSDKTELENDMAGGIIPDGKRNSTMIKLSGLLKRYDICDEAREACLLEVNKRQCNPPLPESEVKSIARRKFDKAYDIGSLPGVPDDELVTEDGKDNGVGRWVIKHLSKQGRELVYDRGGLWCYSPATGLWKAWATEECTALLSPLLGRLKYPGPPNKKGEPTFKPVSVTKNLMDGAYDIIKKLKREEANAEVEGFFDNAPRGRAFTNGFLTIDDCGTITLLPHSPDNRQRKRLDFDWDPSATCPQFDKFLSEVAPQDCIKTLHEWGGVAMVGRSTDYGKMLFLLGGGANGKSVYIKVLRAAFPSGTVKAISPQMMGDKVERAELDQADLNARDELPYEDLKKSADLKSIATGDTTSATRKYRDPFDFKPRAGHLFAANNLPLVTDASKGLWRRMMVCPFPNTFEDHQQDKTLADRIIKQELPGVIALMVKAAAETVKRGHFAEPQTMTDIASSWRQEADPVQLWLDECCVDDGKWTSARQLFKHYKNWCKDDTNFKPLNDTNWGRRMSMLGIEKKKSGVNKYNVSLKPFSGVETVTIPHHKPSPTPDIH